MIPTRIHRFATTTLLGAVACGLAVGLAACDGGSTQAAATPTAARTPTAVSTPAPKAEPRQVPVTKREQKPPAPPTQVTGPAADYTAGFPESWYYPDRRTGRRYAHLAELEGNPAPAFQLRDWIGSPQTMDDLEGKVVVIDFWATWCRPCMAAVPKNVKLVEKFRDRGLAFIGIHDNRRGYQRMAQAAQQLGMNYPVGIDDGGVSQKAYRVTYWPTYTVIDHNGIVRAAGLMPHTVEKVVEALIAEREADLG
ncbi:MAG: TlpA family protein disulfide reductase [Planctomycetes bacterium]|nr:TlpA family protein disulfide reductase [Planctomycetota bacterium]